MRIYVNVRNYIEEKGLEQDEVARRAGIGEAVFKELMCGKRVLNADDLRLICFALGVQPEIFFRS